MSVTSLTRHRARAAAAVLAAALVLTGCSGDDTGGAGEPTAAEQTATDEAGTDETVTDEPADAETDPAQATDPGEAESAAEAGIEPHELGEPFASVDTAANMPDDPEATLTYDVFELQRDGDVVTFAARLTVNSDSTGSNNLASIMGVGSNFSIGVSLIDTVNMRRHAIVQAGSDRLSSTPLAMSMSGGQSRYISGIFAAPPEDVTTMTVLIDGIPAIPNVPIR